MSDDRNFPQDWMTADSEIGIKSCLCGKDACIGASNLRPLYHCIRELGEAAIAKLVAPVADAGVKRPEVKRYDFEASRDYASMQEWETGEYVLYSDYAALELQLKTVLDRESATAVRYDAKLDALELQLAQAQVRNGELAERVKELEFLSPAFLAAMNDIGRYGHHKYGEQSFQHRRVSGDLSRGDMDRTLPDSIAGHAARHFSVYLAGIEHDHFNTLGHQLAAVAFNAMMEFYFAGLESESCVSSAASGKDGE